MRYNNETLHLTKELILKKVTEEDIFTRYLGITPVERIGFTNPKRKDNNADCRFYINDRGTWKFKDFAGGFNWDCFNVVEYEYNCSFKEALQRIAIDFGIVDGKISDLPSSNKPIRSKRKTEFRVKKRPWTKDDLIYWEQYGITESQLIRYEVTPVSHIWSVELGGNLRLRYTYDKNDICFCYHFVDYEYKLYFPFREKHQVRWLQSSSSYIQGYNQLPKFGKNLLFTKSLKDVLALDNYSNLFDLYSVAPLSETVLITLDQFKDLYNRFDNQATLFDFDRTGIRLMRQYESVYQLPFYMFGVEYKKQGIKDFADHRKIKGDNETKRLIERFVKTRFYDDIVF